MNDDAFEFEDEQNLSTSQDTSINVPSLGHITKFEVDLATCPGFVPVGFELSYHGALFLELHETDAGEPRIIWDRGLGGPIG